MKWKQPKKNKLLASENTAGPLKMQQNPFRTAYIKVYSTSLPWKKMQSKLKYVAWCEESDMGAEMTYFRVYAYKVVGMRMHAWRKMFEGMSVSVEKIEGRLDENKVYKACLMNGQLSEWGGRPYPACTRDTMASSGDSGDNVFISVNDDSCLTDYADDDEFISVNDENDEYESDLTLAPIRDELYKMRISFICSDQDTNEPTDWASVFKKK
jgi:hypothetical protein